MLLEIDKLGSAWTPLEFECSVDDPELAELARLSGPVEVRAEARRKDTRVQVRGKLAGQGEAECSRCLEAAPVSVAAEFDVFYESAQDVDDLHDLEVTDENLSVAEYVGDKIDLKDLAREQVLLNLPVRVLCREDCLGLCEICGANKNLQPCGCEAKATDPRWQALKGLVEP